jgi:hypothetical protein
MLRLLISFCLIFAAFTAHADSVVMVGFGASAGECSSPTVNQEQTEAGTAIDVYTYLEAAQSFQVSSAKKLYSIIAYVNKPAGSTGNAVIRVDDDTDMTSEYLVGATVANASLPTDWSTYAEFVFDSGSRPTLSTGTTYYFIVGSSGDTEANRLQVGYKDGSSAYSSGDQYQDHSGAGTRWLIDTSAWSGRDLYFQVKLCE